VTPSAEPSFWPALRALPPGKRRSAVKALYDALGPLRLRHQPPGFTPTAKQEAFLRLGALEVFYGGSAGGGKTVALLAAAAQYADVPGYSALLVRRTWPELVLPGGLLPLSHAWWDQSDASWVAGERQWRFASGATITLGHLDHHSMRRYQGAAFQFIGFDELTHFPQGAYEFLFSRLRRPEQAPTLATSPDGLSVAAIPLRMRSASNPGGPGHMWVKRRFVDQATRAEGALYLPARLHENPYLDQQSYTTSLRQLSALERGRLLEGDWSAREAGALFQREWLTILDQTPHETEIETRIRAWDLAATEPTAANPNPDYTVGVRMERTHDGRILVTDVRRVRLSPASVERLIARTMREDGPACAVWIEQEPGASGKLFVSGLMRRLGGIAPAYGQTTSGDKLTRAKPLAAAWDRGDVALLPGAWTAAYLDEHEAFPYDEHDDQVDASALAYSKLASGVGALIETPERNGHAELPDWNPLTVTW